MVGRHDDWTYQWNVERLVIEVETVLQLWERDPHRADAAASPAGGLVFPDQVEVADPAGDRNARRRPEPQETVEHATKLDHLLRTASPRVLVLLEATYRGRRHTLAPMLGPRANVLAEDFGRHAAAVAALLTFDRSGYLREAGARLLAGSGEAFALPFLLLRFNDPVDVVRQLAVDGVREWLGTNHIVQMVPLAPLIETLRRRRRAGPLMSTMTGLLLGSGGAALRAGTRSADPAVRASCRRLLALDEPTAASQIATPHDR